MQASPRGSNRGTPNEGFGRSIPGAQWLMMVYWSGMHKAAARDGVSWPPQTVCERQPANIGGGLHRRCRHVGHADCDVGHVDADVLDGHGPGESNVPFDPPPSSVGEDCLPPSPLRHGGVPEIEHLDAILSGTVSADGLLRRIADRPGPGARRGSRQKHRPSQSSAGRGRYGCLGPSSGRFLGCGDAADDRMGPSEGDVPGHHAGLGVTLGCRV